MSALIAIVGMALTINEVSAQGVVRIASQTLTTDQTFGSSGQIVEFEPNAKVVTNGFRLRVFGKLLKGNAAKIFSFTAAAPDGSSGTNGANGGDGGDGRHAGAIVIRVGTYEGEPGSLEIFNTGQDGGKGGNGGIGATGASGSNGRGPDVSDCWIGNCRRGGTDGGPGGPGGDAGDGGDAGNGGNGGTVMIVALKGGEAINIDTRGGAAGVRGNAGTAGAGGPGGQGGNGHLCCSGGRAGSSGPSGRQARTGREGTVGTPGQVARFDPADLQVPQ